MKSLQSLDTERAETCGIAGHRCVRLTLSRARALDLSLMVGVFVVALIPRWILLHQLDIITDESVYVPVGWLDVSLLAHGQIFSSSWLVNFEAPPLPKLFMGLAEGLAGYTQPSLATVQAARVPGAIVSSLTLALLYPLGKPIFGRWAALLGALCLALSPWYSYFGSIAYLDIYAASFVNLAFLTLWYARRRPRLYYLVGVLLGLGFASKYTAALAVPGMLAFLFYRYMVGEKTKLPWRMLGLTALVGLGALYLADPAIWVNPVVRLAESVGFQFGHAEQGHRTFFAGSYGGHVPPGAVFLILLVKISLFVVIPALLLLPWAIFRLIRYWRTPQAEDMPVVFGLCWLGGLLVPFSFLSIVVGTHYMLPLAAPICLMGAYALLRALPWAASRLVSVGSAGAPGAADKAAMGGTRQAIVSAMFQGLRSALAERGQETGYRGRLQMTMQVLILVIAAVALVVPHTVGLIRAPGAEGYTSELFASENGVLQVAYPDYADAVVWLHQHAHQDGKVGLVSLPGALDYWIPARQDLQTRAFPLYPVLPSAVAGYAYLVWPMHLIQRGYPPPSAWQGKTVHAIMGGATIYCFILAWNPANVTP